MEKTIDLKGFIEALVENSYRGIKTACAGLTDEQLWYQPTLESNSMAWLAWHLSRAKDAITAAISGETEVWVSEGWAERFGMDRQATGIGDSPEQVTAFRVSNELVFGYVDSAHRATIQRLSKITPGQFDQPTVYVLGDSRPVWQALAGMIGDSGQHNGQIAYLRGIITGYGWRQRAGLH